MHSKTETQSPRSKLRSSLFPDILHPSAQPTLLDDRQKTRSTPSQDSRENEHQTAHEVDHHHIPGFMINLLSRMFELAAYQQCTSSTPCWLMLHNNKYASKSNEKGVIIIDDLVLLEDRESEEQDGGPICREATIESWKVQRK